MGDPQTEILFAVHSDKGLRKNNQDCGFAGSIKNASGIAVGVACVADGVGGGSQGEQAAALAVNRLCDLIRNSAFGDVTALKVLMPSWIDELNREIQKLASGDMSVNTTLSACLIADHRSLVVHIGDTRVYVVDENSAKPVTEDHNEANEALKKGIDEEFVNSTDFRALSRCLGSGIEKVDADIIENIIPSGTACWIVVTSDGVHDKVPSSTLFQYARAARSALELAEDLVQWALKARTKDNATVAVLRVGNIHATGKKPLFPSAANLPDVHEPSGRVKNKNILLIGIAQLLMAVAVPLFWYALKSDSKSARISPAAGFDLNQSKSAGHIVVPGEAAITKENTYTNNVRLNDQADQSPVQVLTQPPKGIADVTIILSVSDKGWSELADLVNKKMKERSVSLNVTAKDIVDKLPMSVQKRKKDKDNYPIPWDKEKYSIHVNIENKTISNIELGNNN
jgi:protein phosphatase